MSAWAKVGAKCVCVIDDWTNCASNTGIAPTRVPMINEILTIVATTEYRERLFLRFEEIPDAGSPHGWYFEVEAFRPLTLRERDMEMFHEIAADADGVIDILEPVT